MGPEIAQRHTEPEVWGKCSTLIPPVFGPHIHTFQTVELELLPPQNEEALLHHLTILED